MFKKLFLVLFLISISNLYSHEIDSVEDLAKPKYVNLTLGAGIPELINAGINVRIFRGLYIGYKFGILPEVTNHKFLIDIDQVTHTGEIIKYFDFKDESKFTENFNWNIAFAYTVIPNVMDSWSIEKEISDRIIYNARIGYDFYLTDYIVFQFGLGVAIGYSANDRSSNAILPAIKLNFLYWF